MADSPGSPKPRDPLVPFILDELADGELDLEIASKLLDVGWDKDEVTSAFERVSATKISLEPQTLRAPAPKPKPAADPSRPKRKVPIPVVMIDDEGKSALGTDMKTKTHFKLRTGLTPAARSSPPAAAKKPAKKPPGQPAAVAIPVKLAASGRDLVAERMESRAFWFNTGVKIALLLLVAGNGVRILVGWVPSIFSGKG